MENFIFCAPLVCPEIHLNPYLKLPILHYFSKAWLKIRRKSWWSCLFRSNRYILHIFFPFCMIYSLLLGKSPQPCIAAEKVVFTLNLNCGFFSWNMLKLITLYKKMKFSVTNFFNKCEQNRRKRRMENFIFCAVLIELVFFSNISINPWNIKKNSQQSWLEITSWKIFCTF